MSRRYYDYRPETRLAVLKLAREKLADGWIQCRTAENDQGKPRLVTDPDACRFCLTGAISYAVRKHGAANQARAALRDTAEEVSETLRRRCERVEGMTAERRCQVWNDNRRREQAQVLTLMDQTIDRMELQID